MRKFGSFIAALLPLAPELGRSVETVVWMS